MNENNEEILGAVGVAVMEKMMKYLLATTEKYLVEGKGFDWIEKALVSKHKIPPEIAHDFIEGVKRNVSLGVEKKDFP